MEIYKRKVSYTDYSSRTKDGSITANTLFFPFLLTQNCEDIGIYDDTKNPVYEIVDFSGVWKTSSNTGTGQNPCLILNNCTVNITSTPITYYNANNGSLSATILGCPGPQTIQWSGPNGFSSNNLTINNLASGSYTVKVTDANCNMTFTSYYLTQPQSLSVSLNSTSSLTNATSIGGCNGTATALVYGGLAPYTYTWYSATSITGTTIIAGPSTTLSALTSLCAGQYTAQIVDSSNPPVLVSQTFNVTEPKPISGTVVTTTNIDCNATNTGSITAVATGGITSTGYTFTLTGPTNLVKTSTSNVVLDNLLGGTYSLLITDQIGNSTTLSPITITQPVAITLTLNSINDSTCYGAENGNITVTPSGGVPPYELTVTRNSADYGTFTVNSSTPYTLSNLDVGTYVINVKDSNSCNGPSLTNTIKQRPILNANLYQTPTINGYNIRCFGSTTGITAYISYTTDSTTYPAPGNFISYYIDGVYVGGPTVFGPPANKVINNLTAGTHTIKAVDQNGCSAERVFTLTQPPLKLSLVGGIDTIVGVSGRTGCSQANTRQGIVNVTGGIAPYTITWTMTTTIGGTVSWGTGITSDLFCLNESAFSSLNVKVVDGNGCTITSSIPC